MSAANRPVPAEVRGDATGKPQAIDFALRGEYIALDALLKATGLAASGGTAKALVADGQVQVDGEVERRKTCKIRAGRIVTLGEISIRVQATV